MRSLAFILVLALATMDAAQNTTPIGGRARNPVPTSTKTGKPVIPDPDLLDGSKLEAEKRPLYGMLSEIEMGEKEGGKADKISPNSGPEGSGKPSEEKGGQGGTQAAAGGSDKKIAEGPEADAQGIQVANLKVPEGAEAAGQGGAQSKNLQIGDATLQIQTTNTPSPDVVGTQVSNAQQYEKKVPAGQQSNNRNQGVEKGQVIPQGL